MNRAQLANLGQQTVAILKEGLYRLPDGAEVNIRQTVERSVQATRLIRPNDWDAIIQQARMQPEHGGSPLIEVNGETTLQAARRLVENEGLVRLLILNFASAKNPGGGFLGGSRAQEESLARSSALYASLLSAQEYYDRNRQQRSCLYTDHAILSPDVPVFRDDDGSRLKQPYLVSFFTMPAVNLGAIRPGSPDLKQVEAVMAGRIQKLLALSVAENYPNLILGAWGCGVFRNDPRLIAQLFRRALLGPDRWAQKLNRVVFAVFDPSPAQENLRAFQDVFSVARKGAV